MGVLGCFCSETDSDTLIQSGFKTQNLPGLALTSQMSPSLASFDVNLDVN